jgi:hypothetical protein
LLNAQADAQMSTSDSEIDHYRYQWMGAVVTVRYRVNRKAGNYSTGQQNEQAGSIPDRWPRSGEGHGSIP